MTKKARAKKAAEAKATSKKSERSLESVFQMVLIAGGLIAAYHVAVAGRAPQPTEEPTASKGIVVVDSKAVLGSFMELMEARIANGEELTEGQLTMSGQDFAAEYMRAIKEWKDSGYLVLDKQYALGVPSDTEITAQIGNALSLDVEVTPDPFAAPALD
jgi:hypothetical protein